MSLMATGFSISKYQKRLKPLNRGDAVQFMNSLHISYTKVLSILFTVFCWRLFGEILFLMTLKGFTLTYLLSENFNVVFS